MSYINICNLLVKNDPAPFLSPFAFSITFECLQPIKEEIEWKIIYVGCPRDDNYDQELDSFSLGPFLEPGVMQFDIECPAPDCSKIPQEDLLGVSAIIHSVSYQKQEFFRVGYFIHNNYEDPYLLENPYPVQVDKMVRSILADKPRIIRHNIDWESECTEKVHALNSILVENSNVMNNDNTINFRGMFSDAGQDNQAKPDPFSGFSWGQNNNNVFQQQQQNNGMGMFQVKENFGGDMNKNPFMDNQQYNNQNKFMETNNLGGFNQGQQGFFQQQNTPFGLVDITNQNQQQQFGGGFFGNNMGGMNFNGGN